VELTAKAVTLDDAEQIVNVTVNGTSQKGLAEPRLLLVDFLRDVLGLTGTHVGCEHGVCGACTILFNGEVVRSCIMLAVQADGAEIETVEGLATGSELHPIQQAYRTKHGLQCGFCTPGFLLTTKALLETNADPSDPEIREFLAGNVCRCTGYMGIVDSVKEAARMMREEAGR
jgi:carbon-monoxide dehydrogenase small subunit